VTKAVAERSERPDAIACYRAGGHHAEGRPEQVLRADRLGLGEGVDDRPAHGARRQPGEHRSRVDGDPGSDDRPARREDGPGRPAELEDGARGEQRLQRAVAAVAARRRGMDERRAPGRGGADAQDARTGRRAVGVPGGARCVDGGRGRIGHTTDTAPRL
jgi:hypothetical protein